MTKKEKGKKRSRNPKKGTVTTSLSEPDRDINSLNRTSDKVDTIERINETEFSEDE